MENQKIGARRWVFQLAGVMLLFVGMGELAMSALALSSPAINQTSLLFLLMLSFANAAVLYIGLGWLFFHLSWGRQQPKGNRNGDA